MDSKAQRKFSKSDNIKGFKSWFHKLTNKSKTAYELIMIQWDKISKINISKLRVMFIVIAFWVLYEDLSKFFHDGSSHARKFWWEEIFCSRVVFEMKMKIWIVPSLKVSSWWDKLSLCIRNAKYLACSKGEKVLKLHFVIKYRFRKWMRIWCAFPRYLYEL